MNMISSRKGRFPITAGISPERPDPLETVTPLTRPGWASYSSLHPIEGQLQQFMSMLGSHSESKPTPPKWDLIWRRTALSSSLQNSSVEWERGRGLKRIR
uniref:Uncharacterized protein n=1 Tax=Opuntia streptacantha TaxID=393608 RepID=A0A7C8YUZ1_OPUST